MAVTYEPTTTNEDVIGFVFGKTKGRERYVHPGIGVRACLVSVNTRGKQPFFRLTALLPLEILTIFLDHPTKLWYGGGPGRESALFDGKIACHRTHPQMLDRLLE